MREFIIISMQAIRLSIQSEMPSLKDVLNEISATLLQSEIRT